MACSEVRYVSNGVPADSALSRLSGTCDEYLECLPLPDRYKPRNTHTHTTDKQFCHARRVGHARPVRFASHRDSQCSPLRETSYLPRQICRFLERKEYPRDVGNLNSLKIFIPLTGSRRTFVWKTQREARRTQLSWQRVTRVTTDFISVIRSIDRSISIVALKHDTPRRSHLYFG